MVRLLHYRNNCFTLHLQNLYFCTTSNNINIEYLKFCTNFTLIFLATFLLCLVRSVWAGEMGRGMMIHRNQLIKVNSSDQDQGTGALLRKYLRDQQQKGNLQPPPRSHASHTTLERMARLRGDDLAMEETRIIPQSEALYLPRILRYREVNKPLELLHSTVLESIRTLDAIPDMLFIARARIPELKAETERIQHRHFDSYFVYYSGQGKLEYIPVYAIETLPEALGYPLGEAVNRDEVYAVINATPARNLS